MVANVMARKIEGPHVGPIGAVVAEMLSTYGSLSEIARAAGKDETGKARLSAAAVQAWFYGRSNPDHNTREKLKKTPLAKYVPALERAGKEYDALDWERERRAAAARAAEGASPPPRATTARLGAVIQQLDPGQQDGIAEVGELVLESGKSWSEVLGVVLPMLRLARDAARAKASRARARPE